MSTTFSGSFIVIVVMLSVVSILAFLIYHADKWNYEVSNRRRFPVLSSTNNQFTDNVDKYQELLTKKGYSILIKDALIASKSSISHEIEVNEGNTTISTTIRLRQNYEFRVEQIQSIHRRLSKSSHLAITNKFWIFSQYPLMTMRFFKSMDIINVVALLIGDTKIVKLQQFDTIGTTLHITATIHPPTKNAIWYLRRLDRLYCLLEEKMITINPSPALEQAYICFTCGTELSFEGRFCLTCQESAPTCIICFIDPEPGDSILSLNCCNSYAHEIHLLTWLFTSNRCPYCRKPRPKYSKVKLN